MKCAFSERVEACDVALTSARKQVSRHFQAFRQAVDRFIESGEKIVEWARVLVPKLRLLGQHAKVLRTCAELQRHLSELEGDKIAAEDELDMVEMELRRYRRRTCGSCANRSTKAPEKDVEVAVMFASRLELNHQLRLEGQARQQRLEGHVRQLEIELQEAKTQLQAAVRELPIAVEIEDVPRDVWSLEGEEERPSRRSGEELEDEKPSNLPLRDWKKMIEVARASEATDVDVDTPLL